jgi:hypothetical protein
MQVWDPWLILRQIGLLQVAFYFGLYAMELVLVGTGQPAKQEVNSNCVPTRNIVAAARQSGGTLISSISALHSTCCHAA